MERSNRPPSPQRYRHSSLDRKNSMSPSSRRYASPDGRGVVHPGKRMALSPEFKRSRTPDRRLGSPVDYRERRNFYSDRRLSPRHASPSGERRRSPYEDTRFRYEERYSSGYRRSMSPARRREYEHKISPRRSERSPMRLYGPVRGRSISPGRERRPYTPPYSPKSSIASDSDSRNFSRESGQRRFSPVRRKGSPYISKDKNVPVLMMLRETEKPPPPVVSV